MRAYADLPAVYAPPPLQMQESLRAHGAGDSVRVLWDKAMHRWEVQTWGAITKQWHYAFLWAHYGKDGSVTPKPLPYSCQPLLEWLARIDDARFGRTPEENRRLAMREMDESRAERLRQLRAKKADVVRHVAMDLAARKSGMRYTVGAGGAVRSRTHYENQDSELVQARAELSALMKE